ncbi:MAG: D-aminoacyl-tRNA deacylase [Myxococcaceae bacterium]
MRALLQRVLSASVTVDDEVIGRIGPGLLVLLGVGKGDTEQDVDWAVEKIANLRIFEDDAGKMNRSVSDDAKALLCVSQFTLYADTSKGRRPSFVEACEPTEAKRLYEFFCERARALELTVETGRFAADMKVALINDGPVTLWLDSRKP